MTIQEFIIVDDTSNPWGNDVSKSALCCLVDAGSKAVQMQMWGEVVIVILHPVRVHVREKGCHGVCKFHELDGPQEHPTLSAVVVVEFHLGLEAKEEKKSLSEVENVLDVSPGGDADGDRQVKARDSGSSTRHR